VTRDANSTPLRDKETKKYETRASVDRCINTCENATKHRSNAALLGTDQAILAAQSNLETFTQSFPKSSGQDQYGLLKTKVNKNSINIDFIRFYYDILLPSKVDSLWSNTLFVIQSLMTSSMDVS
jgi:hypothetical protein